jgi:hypothetical protein
MTKIMASDQLPEPKRRFQVIVHNGDTIIYDADSAFPLNTHGVLTGYEWVLIERDENDQPILDPDTGEPILNNWGQVISSPATLIDYQPWMGFTEFDSMLQDCIERAKQYRRLALEDPVIEETPPVTSGDDGIYA